MGESASEISYIFYGDSSMILGGVEYFLDLIRIDVALGADSAETVGFDSQTPLLGPELYAVGASFTGLSGFLDDPRRLPSSLEEWQLDKGGLELYFDYSDASDFSLARTFSYSHLSITTIPEPSSLAIAAIGMFLPVLRRRRAV